MNIVTVIDPDWVSAIAAIGAVLFSVMAHRSAKRSQDRADILEDKNAKFLEFQTKINHKTWSDAYFREISQWACRVSTSVSSAIHIIDVDDPNERRHVLSELSACIDMGRWYFPNHDHDKKGVKKEPAYRGVRQPVLDWIVYAYDVLDEGSGESAKQQLMACQRNFVSVIQAVLDPRSREKEIARILADFSNVSSLPEIKSPPE